MATVLYINPDPATQDRATALGCGWMAQVPPQYASVATAPCVIVAGQGTTTVLPEPTTAQAVASALAPILTAEQAAAAAAATQAGNLQTITSWLDTEAQTVHTWLVNNPNGALLTAPQTLKMMQGLERLILLARQNFTTPGTGT